MCRRLPRASATLFLVLFILIVSVRSAAGQPPIESVGERALGMGGAFVAVADDSTAVHWNPAGLVAGGPAGMTIGWYRFQNGNQDAAPAIGQERRTSNFTSLGTWPMGVSYGRFQTTSLVSGGIDGVFRVQTLSTTQYGLTILQSVAQGLVVGSTLRYLRGDVGSGLSTGGTAGGALDLGDQLKGHRTGAFDLDLGVMADMSRLRVGLTLKNLRSPTFGDAGSGSITLPRQGRLGVALLPTAGLTLAMDMDLDTVDLQGDLRRMMALGGEGHLGPYFAIRSGIRWSLKGARQPIESVGASVRLRSGFWLDWHYAQGHLGEDRELGAALRAGR